METITLLGPTHRIERALDVITGFADLVVIIVGITRFCARGRSCGVSNPVGSLPVCGGNFDDRYCVSSSSR